MLRWLSVAGFISLPCLVALVAYDWVTVVAIGRGIYRLVPWHDFAQDILQDLGLTAAYAVTVTPRVVNVVANYSKKASRACLIMLGLGLAWYAMICAWMTRALNVPPDLWISLVVLFVIPVMLAPWYVQWLKTKVPEG